MRPVEDGWTIVLIGAWNQAILNPFWVAKYLLDEDTQQPVDLTIAAGAVEERRLTFPNQNFRMTTIAGRVMLTPLTLDEGDIRRVQDIAIRLLSTLQYTPVSAVGMNFRFVADRGTTSLDDIFAINDGSVLSDLGLRRTLIDRRLDGIEEFGRPILNLRIMSEVEQPELRLELNYHYSVESAAEAADRIPGAFVGLAKHARALVARYSGGDQHD